MSQYNTIVKSMLNQFSIESQEFESEEGLKESGEVLIDIDIEQTSSQDIAEIVSSLESKGWKVELRYNQPSTEASTDDPNAMTYVNNATIANTNDVVNGVHVSDLIKPTEPKKVQVIHPEDTLQRLTADAVLYLKDNDEVTDYLRQEGYKVATTAEELHEALTA